MSVTPDDDRYPSPACRRCPHTRYCGDCPEYTGQRDNDDEEYDDNEDPGEPIRGTFPKYRPSMRKE